MSRTLKRELAGIALLLLAVFIGGALAFQRLVPDAACADGTGIFGPVGSCMKAGLLALFGAPAAALIPLLPAVHGLRLLGRPQTDTDRSWLIFLTGVILLLPAGIGLAGGAVREPGTFAGLWGNFVAFYSARALGSGGAWILLALCGSGLMAATLAWNPVRALIGPTRKRHDPRHADSAATASGTAPRSAHAVALEPTPEEMPAIGDRLHPALDDAALSGSGALKGDKRKRDRKSKSEEIAANSDRVAAEIDAIDAVDLGGSELPPSMLLTPAPERHADLGKRELDAMGQKLMDALRTFRVEGVLVGRTTGPVVTQFEIEPAPGVKVRQFANLANDLALAMRAASIRIVAPIPGRGAVGVEVPNPTAEIVAFREMIESREFQLARASLPIALGKDLEGKPIVDDLAKMPHLLIAGATGSGKSVCVNTIITSLVYRHTPETLRLLMVDPKMVELSVYQQLPHLRHKVVTDNRDAAAVLKWAVMEMQQRYELLAANGARNIQDFNKRVRDGAKLKASKGPGVVLDSPDYIDGVLPYIVVIIDELADLMMTVAAEVETPLAMLAQKARAIGIHLILATQRPSVNVITGLIKANFPSRIAFRVASQVDSRTILDGNGAETLLGNGDMLFIPPGKSEPMRLQGAFISGDDTERLMEWYRALREQRRQALASQGLVVGADQLAKDEPDIIEAVRAREALESSGDEDDEGPLDADRDKLFRRAAEVVIQHQQGSTSLLQRRLEVGYGRAARIIDQLHAAGVLGPPNASKPRDVLVGLEDIDRICGPRD